MGYWFLNGRPIKPKAQISSNFSKLTFPSASSLLSELTNLQSLGEQLQRHLIIHSQIFVVRTLECRSVIEPRKPRKQPNQYPNLNLNCSHHNSSTSKSKVHIYTSIFSFFPFYERAFSSIYFYRLMLAISMLC